MAKGKPSEEELKVLEPLRNDLRPEVFEEAYVPPVSDGSGQDRKLLRQASQLLAEAGWKRQGTQLVNAKGEKFTIEFLIDDPSSERITAPYVKNLRLLGIDATMRSIDPAQHEQRIKEFDFDMDIVRLVGRSNTRRRIARPARIAIGQGDRKLQYLRHCAAGG